MEVSNRKAAFLSDSGIAFYKKTILPELNLGVSERKYNYALLAYPINKVAGETRIILLKMYDINHYKFSKFIKYF